MSLPQPLLFSVGQATADLFDVGIVIQHIEALRQLPAPPYDLETARRSVQQWAELVKQNAASRRRSTSARALTESNLEQGFNEEVLRRAFGFRGPSGTDRYSLLPKDPTRTGIPDAAIGLFDGENRFAVGMLELKSAGVDLDVPQSRMKRESPVEQAFRTAASRRDMRWLIVSNFDEIRLYHVSQPQRYFRFFLSQSQAHTYLPQVDDLEVALAIMHASQLLPSDPATESNTDRLIAQTERKISAVRGGFYSLFSQARADLYKAILATFPANTAETRKTALSKAQKLLDRIIFIRFCEDHPSQLLPRDRLKSQVRQAPNIGGRRTDKVYLLVKAYFEEIRDGSVPGSPYTIFAYDGELFDDDEVLDAINLPDSLFQQRYTAKGEEKRSMVGPFGFWEYNFNRELNEHLLGHIYEQSLSDLSLNQLFVEHPARDGATANELRARYGIWYTPETLTTYLASIALTPILDGLFANHVGALSATANVREQISAYRAYYDAVTSVKILDPACGSGAFLVSCFEVLASACRGARLQIENLEGAPTPDLFLDQDRRLLQGCLFGVDLNHEAVAITKLALWLKTAYKQAQNIDLSQHIVTGNSLSGDRSFPDVAFDLVIGNPPWGAQWTAEEREEYRLRFASERGELSSEEAFILAARRFLKPGGRLAYVVPDTLLYPEKFETRRLLLTEFRLRNISAIGPEWFTSQNRMATLILDAEFSAADADSRFNSFILVDRERRRAIQGTLSLFQAEAGAGGTIRQDRCVRDGKSGYEIRLFQRDQDDAIMRKLEGAGVPLARDKAGVGLCDRGRGIELNKAGLVLACPACGRWGPPGEWDAQHKVYRDRTCRCGVKSSFEASPQRTIVHDRRPHGAQEAAYIDGDAIHRYRLPRIQAVDLNVAGINYKSPELYALPKIMIRQAGLGINVIVDESGALCPQTVYIYRVAEGAASADVSEAYVAGVLSSRVMHYYLFKRFSEIDSARAHIKVTHERLEHFPIPVPNDGPGLRLAREIDQRVRDIVSATDEHRYRIDLEIEERVAKLFGVTGAERAYMNGQFGLVHENETILGLFPHGAPKPVPLDEAPEFAL